MGVTATLEYCFSFIYKAELDDGLWEHELDHVFVGHTEEEPLPNAEEVAEWRWTSPEELEDELSKDPSRYTVWFPLAYEHLRKQCTDSFAALP
jgi:isopentenyl-diphosphate Delta-isomerase